MTDLLGQCRPTRVPCGMDPRGLSSEGSVIFAVLLGRVPSAPMGVVCNIREKFPGCLARSGPARAGPKLEPRLGCLRRRAIWTPDYALACFQA